MRENFNILCFGDSNTFGYNALTGGRFPKTVRWTGILQDMLGKDFTVIEAGLNGRTTVWDDPIRIHRAGKDDLIPVIEENRPLDLIIIMLGTNDLKTFFNQSSSNIVQGLGYLVGMIEKYPWNKIYEKPRIMIVSPPEITKESYLNSPFSGFDEVSVSKGKELFFYIQKFFKDSDVLILDSSEFTEVGIDGVHLNEIGHKKLAEGVYNYLKDSINFGGIN